ncbi:Nif3-like dinuclear metal center hexameric protein [uncultured Helicobacter sp.]|uniref:Nif3-like dinuclear metal center hexameric protein n=1 Tax=uncultured Helicobacter sp. TaxID=175537 RepID=UPI00258A35A0|nr:Nif3-like dinuclear metal center hexameric protein [uncultured Helicobacter sp.]
MKLSEIYEVLDSISPFALQEKWDNSGLNIGDLHQEIEGIYLALEADLQIVKSLPKNALLITHHPLIFTPLKSLQTAQYPSNLAQILLSNNNALIAMHTNFDKTHLNAHFAKNILGFTEAQECNMAQYCKIQESTIANLALHLKQTLGLETIRFTPLESKISDLYIVCGSGASFLKEILHKPSCLITGDIKYHDAMSALSMNIGCIDVEHYASERDFPKILKSILQIKSLKGIILHNFSPFSYI